MRYNPDNKQAFPVAAYRYDIAHDNHDNALVAHPRNRIALDKLDKQDEPPFDGVVVHSD
jgi:hypothetical protein